MRRTIISFITVALVTVFLFGCVNKRKYYRLTKARSVENPYHIEDIEKYYRIPTEDVRNILEEIGPSSLPCFIYIIYPSFEMVVTRTDPCYMIRRKTIRTGRVKGQDGKDSIVHNPYIKYFEYDLEEEALNEIFEWLDKPTFYYDWATHEYLAIYSVFALVDSLGEIRLMGDCRSQIPTKKYYKKNYGVNLPLPDSISLIVTDLFIDYDAFHE